MPKKETVNKIIKELSKKYPNEKERIIKGVKQAASLWQENNDKEFLEFCLKNFVAKKDLTGLLKKFEQKYEKIGGHFNALLLNLRHELDEDTGEMTPADSLFSSFNPGTHIKEDLFKSKIAFCALLNFQAETLEKSLKEGKKWSREKWAGNRLAQGHLFRVPPEIVKHISDVYSKSAEYVYSYNIFMGKLTDEKGNKLFKDDLKLISHWGLRDHLKTYYNTNTAENFKNQKTIEKLIERIIKQEIPEEFINSAEYEYNPFENTLDKKPVKTQAPKRYEHLKNIFQAHRKEDPYYPMYPTLIERSFNLGREIPLLDLKKMFISLITSKTAKSVADIIRKRVNRELEPFDIWYDGFKSRGAFDSKKLDNMASSKYKNIEDFEKAIPQILVKLGFDKKTAQYLSERIEVDPARGAGHAWGPQMKGEKAHLRTRAEKGGKINYQTFNVAMHELGHCVEQVFSLYKVDNTLLNGVPNTAFTEGFAFVFQNKDMDILGIKKDEKKARANAALDTFWSTMEIAGVALVDIAVWQWMYAKKNFTEKELKDAVVKISKDIWNLYFYPTFKVKDSPILGIYSHMIYHAIYLPDYPLGHIIAWQIEEFFEKNPIGKHMERMCAKGMVAPKLWMEYAVGEDISAKPLIEAAMKAAKEQK